MDKIPRNGRDMRGNGRTKYNYGTNVSMFFFIYVPIIFRFSCE
jgi:hypothetical protein